MGGATSYGLRQVEVRTLIFGDTLDHSVKQVGLRLDLCHILGHIHTHFLMTSSVMLHVYMFNLQEKSQPPKCPNEKDCISFITL